MELYRAEYGTLFNISLKSALIYRKVVNILVTHEWYERE